MKGLRYYLLFVCFLLEVYPICAQQFGANNAIWHFNESQFSTPVINSIEVTSSPSFLYMGDTCRTITVLNQGCMFTSSYLVKQQNDTVFYQYSQTTGFKMLYNYNAMVGDTQTIYGFDIAGNDTSMQVIVTSTGTTLINGILKRSYSINSISPGYFDFSGPIIEDIGSTFFLFPQFGFCDPITSGLRCYEDTVIGLYNTNPSIACDSIIFLGEDEKNNFYNFNISPNLSGSLINIEFSSPISANLKFNIFNTVGQLIVSNEVQVVNSNNHSIDCRNLKKGIYFVVVQTPGSQISQKFIIE